MSWNETASISTISTAKPPTWTSASFSGSTGRPRSISTRMKAARPPSSAGIGSRLKMPSEIEISAASEMNDLDAEAAAPEPTPAPSRSGPWNWPATVCGCVTSALSAPNVAPMIPVNCAHDDCQASANGDAVRRRQRREAEVAFHLAVRALREDRGHVDGVLDAVALVHDVQLLAGRRRGSGRPARCRRRSARPSIETMRSPDLHPGLRRPDSPGRAGRSRSSAARSGTPKISAAPNSSTSATMKFATGPASTIASRCSVRLRLEVVVVVDASPLRNSRCCSASVDLPSSPFIWQ